MITVQLGSPDGVYNSILEVHSKWTSSQEFSWCYFTLVVHNGCDYFVKDTESEGVVLQFDYYTCHHTLVAV